MRQGMSRPDRKGVGWQDGFPVVSDKRARQGKKESEATKAGAELREGVSGKGGVLLIEERGDYRG